MKKCPQCNTIYSDDLSFCLNDGSILVSQNEQETVVIPRKTPSDSLQQPVKQGVNPIFAYLTIGLLALILGGGAVAWIMSRDNLPGDISNSNSTTNKEVVNTERPSKTEQPKANSTETPIPPALTPEIAQSLINTWETAQDKRNFQMYRNCYDTSFRGVKRTVNGSVSNYNYNQWLSDRQKMFKSSYQDVRVDKLRISIQDDTATAEFDQYYRVQGYGDFGPKIMKIKMTENGAKIIYEELKSAVLLTD